MNETPPIEALSWMQTIPIEDVNGKIVYIEEYKLHNVWRELTGDKIFDFDLKSLMEIKYLYFKRNGTMPITPESIRTAFEDATNGECDAKRE